LKLTGLRQRPDVRIGRRSGYWPFANLAFGNGYPYWFVRIITAAIQAVPICELHIWTWIRKRLKTTTKEHSKSIMNWPVAEMSLRHWQLIRSICPDADLTFPATIRSHFRISGEPLTRSAIFTSEMHIKAKGLQEVTVLIYIFVATKSRDRRAQYA
jgi:hypothetical protein